MKKIVLFTFVLAVFIGCVDQAKKPSTDLKLEDIARFALGKSVREVIDSLQLNSNAMTFTDEPPGIIRSIIINYYNKGTLEFFFERSSVISDYPLNNEKYLTKIGDKKIEEIALEKINGEKSKLKSVIIY